MATSYRDHHRCSNDVPPSSSSRTVVRMESSMSEYIAVCLESEEKHITHPSQVAASKQHGE
ncbi:hypothetical protein BDZ89DRAFT_1067208 [Hymenopellis radicata]|nr:hypothetical protein BDZ89DRAFT_1067208 [Hymenopellis radicata]